MLVPFVLVPSLLEQLRSFLFNTASRLKWPQCCTASELKLMWRLISVDNKFLSAFRKSFIGTKSGKFMVKCCTFFVWNCFICAGRILVKIIFLKIPKYIKRSVWSVWIQQTSAVLTDQQKALRADIMRILDSDLFNITSASNP